MGNRVSIQFAKKVENFLDKDNPFDEKSIVLFSHWGGMGFVYQAMQYSKDLQKEIDNGDGFLKGGPLGRMEPNTVMVDFIRYITEANIRITGDLYLAKSEDEGDNSDNGHWIIDLDELKIKEG